jgi:hypothetical protein
MVVRRADTVSSHETSARAWLEATCPNVWTLLNARARRCLPPGLVAYLGPPAAEVGARHLHHANARVGDLFAACGERAVCDAYCRGLSGASTEEQLAEVLCELAVAVALSRIGRALELQPSAGHGRHGARCDFAVDLVGVHVFGEVKRYVDPWPGGENDLAEGRALVAAPPDEAASTRARRPRSMDLVSKLRDVPRQFPMDTINVLFVFHSGFGDNHRYLQAALFGDAWRDADPGELRRADPGSLFAAPAWAAISACYLAHLPLGAELSLSHHWLNPRARLQLPNEVRRVLDQLEPQTGR